MKYFTPDLIERLGSTDEAVAGAAHEEWEGALQRYESYLQSIDAELPKHIRNLANSSCTTGLSGVLSSSRIN
jgi:hypothetical protein